MSLLPQIKKRGTLTENTYEVLREAIINLDLKPGQPLLEEEIGRQLGVSRTPVHAAINQLVHDELAVIVPGRGSFVSELNMEHFSHLFAIRKSLEALSVEECIRHAAEEDLLVLSRIVAEEKKLSGRKAKKMKDFLKSDIEFHLEIAKASGNLYLPRYLEQIISNSSRYTNAYTSAESMGSATDEHEKLYLLIRERDTDGAKEVMLQHLSNVMYRVVADSRREEEPFGGKE